MWVLVRMAFTFRKAVAGRAEPSIQLVKLAVVTADSVVNRRLGARREASLDSVERQEFKAVIENVRVCVENGQQLPLAVPPQHASPPPSQTRPKLPARIIHRAGID